MPGVPQLGMQQQQQQQLQRPQQQPGVQPSPFVGGGGGGGSAMFNPMMPGLYGCGYGMGMALDPFAAWCAPSEGSFERKFFQEHQHLASYMKVDIS